MRRDVHSVFFSSVFYFLAHPSLHCVARTCVFSIVACTLVCVSVVSMRAVTFLGLGCHIPISRKVRKRKTRASRLFSYNASPATHYCRQVEGWHRNGLLERCRDRRGNGEARRRYGGSARTTICVRQVTGTGRAVGPRLQRYTARKNA